MEIQKDLRGKISLRHYLELFHMFRRLNFIEIFYYVQGGLYGPERERQQIPTKFICGASIDF